MQQTKPPDDRTTLGPTDARAGQIIKGGAMRRVLVVSLMLAVAALFVSYLVSSY